jgi:D-erythrulose 1-phosphate 3-epimerase
VAHPIRQFSKEFSMSYALGVNTTFAINRIVEPEELIGTIAQQIGLRRVQLVPEHLDPDWPAALIRDYVQRFNRSCEANGVRITSMLTGTQIRVNQLAHPDPAVREHWRDWMIRFAAIAADLGAVAAGSQIGILTYSDDRNVARRAERLATAIDLWIEVAQRAKAAGLSCLLWEPMSVSREFGETIAECEAVHHAANAAMPLPFKMNLDVDHGDVASANPADRDPYAWVRAFAREAPVIHIKQSSTNKGGHWPFTAEYNAQGRITPEAMLQALRDGNSDTNELVFEFSFRERNPTDGIAIDALRESVEYWRPYVEI